MMMSKGKMFVKSYYYPDIQYNPSGTAHTMYTKGLGSRTADF